MGGMSASVNNKKKMPLPSNKQTKNKPKKIHHKVVIFLQGGEVWRYYGA